MQECQQKYHQEVRNQCDSPICGVSRQQMLRTKASSDNRRHSQWLNRVRGSPPSALPGGGKCRWERFPSWIMLIPQWKLSTRHCQPPKQVELFLCFPPLLPRFPPHVHGCCMNVLLEDEVETIQPSCFAAWRTFRAALIWWSFRCWTVKKNSEQFNDRLDYRYCWFDIFCSIWLSALHHKLKLIYAVDQCLMQRFIGDFYWFN